MKLSRRVERLRPSATLTLNQKAKELARRGRSVVNLTVGEPDFITPQRVRRAAAEAIERGETKYTPASGIPELKDAVLKKIREEYGRAYSRHEVVITAGAKQALFNLCLALLEEGDEVVVVSPYWVSYTEMAEFAGASVRILETRQEEGFEPSPSRLRELIRPGTRLLILNSPSNPTGAVFARATLEGIAAAAAEQPGLVVVSDDIYERFVFDGKPFFSIGMVESFPKGRLVIVNGVSKSYAMTGWRVGYALGPEEIAAGIEKIQSQSTSNASSVSQWAALEALEGEQNDVAAMRAVFEERRNRCLAKLNEIAGVRCSIPGGAFYLFPDLTAFLGRKTPGGRRLTTDLELADYLLEEHGLALVPGSEFGAPGHVRLSYGAAAEALDEGISRLARGLGALT